MADIPKAYNPREVEERIYRSWEEKDLFRARPNPDKKPYSIVIPPPNITGILHMGHALNNTIQDILIRFKRMQNFEAEWMPGTDHAGIATQNVVEKKLREKGIKRQDLGREKFLEEVWRWQEEYGSTIIRQLKKLGCSCDWARTRFTMDEGLSDAVLEVFVRLHKKRLIYKGSYIINWCPRCQTALSDEESQHKDVEGMLYYIKYPIKPANYIVVATTRPETMLGDVAIAVNPKDRRYKGLKGKTVMLPLLERELKIIFDPLVDLKFGTGALKVTPAHDPVDFELSLKHKLERINVMNEDATINSNGGKYEGLDRFRAREAILEDLKASGLFVKSEPHKHAVGHCYRCGTMVEPRLSAQWFVRMKPLAAPAIKAVKNGRIRFHPKRWTKVYLDWMNNIRDWCISRQIWWGHRIPVYYCEKCQETEAANYIIVSKTRPDKCPRCGSADIEQDPDVLDTWFSSWLWPFSTFGWPEDTPELKYFYPTNTLVTAQEIIFFWVARMIMAGLEFMDEVPFKDVYIHGTVRDITGTKMSKSLGNVIDPLEMIDKYGTDALRFSLVSITAHGQDVFLAEGKFELGRNFANKIWNASRFILMNLKKEEVNTDLCVFFKAMRLELPERWILSRFYSTLKDVTKCLDEYRFNEAANLIFEFFWHSFCDWYIEIAKISINEKTTQVILYKVLEKSLRMLHPFMPFVTEEIWRALPQDGRPIMTETWPHIQAEMISKDGEKKMSFLIDVVTAIRNIRAIWNIDPKNELVSIINAHSSEDGRLLKENSSFIKRLSRTTDLKVGKFPRPKESAVSIVKGNEIYLPLEGVVDLEKEKARLKKEEETLHSEISSIESRLRDKNFISKAPADVVERHRTREGELKIQLEKIRYNLYEDSDSP